MKRRGTDPKFTVTSITHHRNGISGRPFYTVEFSFDDGNKTRPSMVAILPQGARSETFEGDVECFVIDPMDPTTNWRGDYFMPFVKQAVVASRKE